MTMNPLGPHTHRVGMARREFLQVGVSGFLGLGTAGVLAGQAAAARAGAREVGRAKSVILVFLTGGPSHFETFDPKPNAPDRIRSEYRTIETNVPGIYFAEHLPELAKRADKLAIVRSMAHKHANHLNATHQILTGQPQPGAFFDKIASRDDYPCYAGTLAYSLPRSDGVPSGVMLPTFLMEGPLTWPGQHAGFLGPKYDPWQIRDNPSLSNFKVESLTLPAGFSVERLRERRDLADRMHQAQDAWLGRAESQAADPFAAQQELAYSVLLSSRVAEAFQIQKEDPRVRDRYGRHMFGQSLLLARRLVEAGVPIVQVNMGRVQNWDSHDNIFDRMKSALLPPTDRGVSTLLDDLEQKGLLDETLVIVTGEFGRAPKLTVQTRGNKPGRDHWPQVFSTVFAGGGVRGGQVIGASDKIGAYPASRPYTPTDLGATVYQVLGVPPETEVRDRLQRPIRVVTGQTIAPLFGSA